MSPLTHLILEEPREPDEKYLEDARLEKGDLVVVVQTLEAGDELGEGAHLPNVVHEALAELLQERILRPPLHRTRLQKRNKDDILTEMLPDTRVRKAKWTVFAVGFSVVRGFSVCRPYLLSHICLRVYKAPMIYQPKTTLRLESPVLG